MRKGKPATRGPLTRDEDYSIVAKSGSAYRGMVQYYLLAQDVLRLRRLKWVMTISMLKTLAAKHRSLVAVMARKYQAVATTSEGPRRCFEVTVPRPGRKARVARFRGISLRRRRAAVLFDRRPILSTGKNELIRRLLAGKCEMCDARTGLHIHHVRKLADLDKPGRSEKPEWARLMAAGGR
ncbi:group II intron reverse transcriptase/maturase [Nonomuraea sp. NPDC050643]|uniref:group II intron reverse transcriptase/maturase n=1 Tax=Nonomuraea sp. NPDC050643 TaxID=3155660 RepID=UPI0034042C80